MFNVERCDGHSVCRSYQVLDGGGNGEAADKSCFAHLRQILTLRLMSHVLHVQWEASGLLPGHCALKFGICITTQRYISRPFCTQRNIWR